VSNYRTRSGAERLSGSSSLSRSSLRRARLSQGGSVRSVQRVEQQTQACSRPLPCTVRMCRGLVCLRRVRVHKCYIRGCW
jgi:hypothetical protein